jgi:hypothetical protein
MGEVMDIPHAPFKDYQSCLDFLVSFGPVQAHQGGYLVAWCAKSGPDEKST